MKLASADLIVWAIIAIVVAIAKGIGKLSASGEDTPESDDTDAPVRPPVARPRPVAKPSTPRPVVRTAQQPQAVPAQIREMMERLAQPRRPVAPPPQPPPLADPEPTPAKPTPAPAPAAARPNRSSQWATALRDKSNVRNIIIGAEIIGPPKGG